MSKVALFLSIFVASTVLTGDAEVLPIPTPGSFSTAKRVAEEVHADNPKTLYCGCTYNADKELDHSSCSYRPKRPLTKSGSVNVRAHRMEWEHVVPASRIGKGRMCWEHKERFETCTGKSGRECCRAVDPVFRAAENDLHNLWPSVGEINGDRSDKEPDYIPGEVREYGQCNVEIEIDFEPSDSSMGEVARAYLYMSKIWGIELTTSEIVLFTYWDILDPPTEWEIEREARIGEAQGSRNVFVLNHRQVKDGKPCKFRHQCCKVCASSQPCGDSCISTSKTCSKEQGCTCSLEEICEE